MDQKQIIIDALDIMRRKEVSAGKAKNAVFKARAYADAIRILKGIPRICVLVHSCRFRNIPLPRYRRFDCWCDDAGAFSEFV